MSVDSGDFSSLRPDAQIILSNSYIRSLANPPDWLISICNLVDDEARYISKDLLERLFEIALSGDGAVDFNELHRLFYIRRSDQEIEELVNLIRLSRQTAEA